MQCKICGQEATAAFSAKVLERYDVSYHSCPGCGFMQTDEPYWLSESYDSAINEIDIGPVDRAINGSRLVEGVILSSFDRGAKFVDYGAGYGVLVRLMRDRGFDFYWQDLHCENVFAKHFVAQPGTKFELLTAFEVFEHLADPLAEIETMLGLSRNLLFTTLLLPEEVRGIDDWWYFGPEHGQHIAFYTVPALRAVAKRFGLHLATNGRDTHLLSEKPISEERFRFFSGSSRWASLARRLMRRRMPLQSLLPGDFHKISGHTL